MGETKQTVIQVRCRLDGRGKKWKKIHTKWAKKHHLKAGLIYNDDS